MTADARALRTVGEQSMTLAEPVLPQDVHNEKLVSRVHPPDWVNPEPASRYNLVVIGAGTAGLVTAAGAAGLGARRRGVSAFIIFSRRRW